MLQRVGRGAYGEVWLARSALGTLRAVKVVRREDFSDARPFEREFRGIQKFEPVSRSHPGLIDILQVGSNEAEGCFYYVMELADPAPADADRDAGVDSPAATRRPPDAAEASEAAYQPRSLRRELQVRGRLPSSECLGIGLIIAGALEHLHAAGLVHRDVKPSNIVFVRGLAKLADIGLVTDAGDAHSLVGTDGYLPPEGAGAPEADVYSLGKVLYEMSTGLDRRSFPELPAEETDPAERRTLSELNAVVLRACNREPGGRYPTATALRRDLERLERGGSIRRRRTWETAGRRVASTVPALLVLLALALWVAASRRRAEGSGRVVPERASVFVLPFRFEDPTNNGRLGSVPGRTTDAFIDALASLEGVRRSPRRCGWAALDEAEVRRSLTATNDARHVLTGRIFEQGGRLEIGLELWPRQGGASIWRGTVRGSTNALAVVEREGLEHLARVLGLRPTPEEWAEIDRLLAANVKAGRLIDEASALYERDCMVLASCQRVIEMADEARRIDPRYLDAWFWRSSMQRDFALFSRRPAEIWPAIQREMEAILREDCTHTAALDFMYAPTLFRNWDWAGADAWAQRQLRYEFPIGAHFIRATWLRSHGEFAQARIEQALSEKAPLLDQARALFAFGARWVDGEYDEGIRLVNRFLEQFPDRIWPNYCLAHLHIARGDYPAGLAAIEKIERINRLQCLIALRGYAFAKMGKPAEARAALQEVQDYARSQGYLECYHPARVLAALGDTEGALDWLEQAERDRSEFLVFTDLPGGLRTDPAWQGMATHPRFQALLKRVKLDVWPMPIKPLAE